LNRTYYVSFAALAKHVIIRFTGSNRVKLGKEVFPDVIDLGKFKVSSSAIASLVEGGLLIELIESGEQST
jgi:hypothetical protein